ncbi:MAG: peptide deformylase [Bacteriovoracaceae bacterium]|nr:peptide deformylase [Bacteriovoracaceae bacterium]
MIRPICRMGNPILRKKTQEVLKNFLKTKEFGQLLEDMHDSMEHYGGIGIAAPQIGIDWQLALIELMNFNRYGEEVSFPLTVFINPRIEYLTTDLQGFWEGCLSVPGLRGFVERPNKIKVTYWNQNGEEQEIIAQGFLATVLQHELDHLGGILYVDRIKDPKLLSYQEEFEEFIQERTIE